MSKLLGLFCCSVFSLLCLSNAPSYLGGGGKAAYRHYYLGTYYVNEDQPERALPHLRTAQRLVPEQYRFNLALALCLGQTGNTNEGLEVLTAAAPLLSRRRKDYYELHCLQTYIGGLINIYGERYGTALPAIKTAIDEQEALPEINHRRAAGMRNALAYAEVLDQGSPSAHRGLEPHTHVHRRDLERALVELKAAVAEDPTFQPAVENYRMLADTLGETVEIVERRDTLEEQPRYVSNKYDNLPLRMEDVLAFGDYDELIFLLDISGSMVQEKVACLQTTRFNVMRETAQFILDELDPATRVGIGTIGGDCGTVPKQWHPAGELTHAELYSELRFLYPDGTTPLLTTLVETPELFSSTDTLTRAILFISDGENICNLPGVDICDWTNNLAARNIELNVFTFLTNSLDNSGAFSEYACLTDRSGGRVLYLDEDRCALREPNFDLVDRIAFTLPELRRIDCVGMSLDEPSLWGIF